MVFSVMAGADMAAAWSSSGGGGQKFPDGRHVLRLGDSYFSKTAPSYHTMRCKLFIFVLGLVEERGSRLVLGVFLKIATGYSG